MKLVSFERNGPQVGIVKGDQVAIVTGAGWTGPQTITGILTAQGPEGFASLDTTAAEHVALDSLTLLPPVFDPPRIFCIGVNYEEHRLETGRERAPAPIIFIRTPQSQAGHGATITIPPVSTKIDYEGEIAVVIGQGGRAIAAEDAMRHVWAYSAYNDVSIRDWQMHTQQWTPGKNFDGSGGFGPWIVTADEMPESPNEIRVMTRLNGEVMQNALASDMIFSIPEQIAYISTFTALLPGDVIVTGTPGGVGVKRDPQVFMKAGDTVEIEVSGVGILSNRIG